jgi:hypothetical protein
MQLEESLKVLTNNKFKPGQTGLAGGKKLSIIALAMFCDKEFKYVFNGLPFHFADDRQKSFLETFCFYELQ